MLDYLQISNRKDLAERFSSGTSKTLGDIIFIINGKRSSWGNIPDPTGLKNFIKSIKKTMYDPLTKLEQKKSRGGMICSQCGIQNLRNAQYCNGCGSELLRMCYNCKGLNPIDASFCSKCGSQLGISYRVSDKRLTLSDEKHSEVVEPSFHECILPEYSIRINYPSTWTSKYDNLDPNTKVWFQNPTDMLQEGLMVVVDDSIGHMTLDTFVQGNINSLKKDNSDFSLIESTSTTLGGVPAHQIVFLANHKKALTVLTIRNNIAYCLTYYSEPEKYQKFLSSAEQMISSFKFLLSDEKYSEAVEQSFHECKLSEYNVKINYPSTWTRIYDNSNPNRKAVFQFQKDGSAHHVTVFVSIDDTVGSMTLDTFIENTITAMRQEKTDFKLIQSSPSTLSGFAGHKIMFPLICI